MAPDEKQNAVIASAGLHLHGGDKEVGLSVDLILNYGHSRQSMGGLVLLPKRPDRTGAFGGFSSEVTGLSNYVLMQIMRIADVRDWRSVVGRPVVAHIKDDLIIRVQHFLDDGIFLDVRGYYAHWGASEGDGS